MASPRAPKGLSAPGRALWRAITGFTDDLGRALELRPDESMALALACRTVDELTLLEAELASLDQVMVEGSKGQARPHPLFAEVRAHRAAAVKLLADVGVADAEAAIDGSSARSNAGRKLARARWGASGGQVS